MNLWKEYETETGIKLPMTWRRRLGAVEQWILRHRRLRKWYIIVARWFGRHPWSWTTFTSEYTNISKFELIEQMREAMKTFEMKPPAPAPPRNVIFGSPELVKQLRDAANGEAVKVTGDGADPFVNTKEIGPEMLNTVMENNTSWEWGWIHPIVVDKAIPPDRAYLIDQAALERYMFDTFRMPKEYLDPNLKGPTDGGTPS